MSTIRTNTLTDASGGNSMPIADINQGRAKAWFNLNGTGTIAARDTFNISSFVDNDVGNYTVNFAAVRPSANYAPIGSVQANSIAATVTFDINPIASQLVGSHNFRTLSTSASAPTDIPNITYSVSGD